MNRRNSAYRRYLRSWPSLLRAASLAWLYVAVGLQAQAADVLQDLNPAQLRLITHFCTPMQFQSGADAYRTCVDEQLARTQNSSDPTDEALATLSLDEQFAIQSACAVDDDASTNEYSNCINQQLNAIEEQRPPQLSRLTKDEQYVVSQQCFETQTSQGAFAYRECVADAVESLADLPAAQFNDKSAAERNNIQLECSLFSTEVSSYRQCLLTALGIDFDAIATPSVEDNLPTVSANAAQTDSEARSTTESPRPAVGALTPDNEASTNPLSTSTPLDSAADELQQIQDSENSTTSDSTQDTSSNASPASGAADNGSAVATPSDNSINSGDSLIQTETATDTLTDIAPPVISFRQRLKNVHTQFGALSPTQKVALFASWAVALLVIGLHFLGKPAQHASTRKKGKRTKRGAHKRHSRTITPSTPNLSPVEMDSGTQRNNNNAVDLDAITVDLDALKERDTITASPDTSTIGSDDPLDAAEVETQTVETDSSNNSRRFSAWLNDFPLDTQREFAIELLIYWMAYADNRFDPDLKRRILQMSEPDSHSLIKRWAFIKDAHALSDAISFLQEHCSVEQREQIIDLLLALLVNENALTPIQNNILRFLSDAFGLGMDGLNRQYKRAYGSDMPAIPRPDKIIWWDKLGAEQKLRWDARAIAIQPDNIRHRIALGQPLKGDLNKDAVTASFNLAARRCHRNRVSKLGEREQELMNTQMKKFEHACDALLELVS